MIITKDYRRAMKILSATKSRLTRDVIDYSQVTSYKEMLGRVELMKALIDQEKYDIATEQLMAWRDFTLEALKLP